MADDPYRSPQAQVAEPEAPHGPSGLGGWLVLVGIGLAVTAVRLSAFLVTTLVPVVTGDQWAQLTTPGTSSYHPFWAPLLMIETAGNLFFVGFAVTLLYLYFQKAPRFPKLFIAYLVLNLVFVTADYFLSGMIPAVAASTDNESVREIVRGLIGACIWVPYMLRSKRVKNTFVERPFAAAPAAPS